MKEIKSFWPFQEIFFDPAVSVKDEIPENLTLNLKKSSSHKQLAPNRIEIITEIFGSLTKSNLQYANLRFVNISIYETQKEKITKNKIRNLSESKVKELIAFLPFYLLKAGVFIEKVEIEEDFPPHKS